MSHQSKSFIASRNLKLDSALFPSKSFKSANISMDTNSPLSEGIFSYFSFSSQLYLNLNSLYRFAKSQREKFG